MKTPNTVTVEISKELADRVRKLVDARKLLGSDVEETFEDQIYYSIDAITTQAEGYR